MTVADDALIGEAVDALGVIDEGAIGAAGGQKAVRRVSRDGQPFVLKVVALEFTTDETLKRAEREVQLLASISNPNVVRVESDLVELGSPVSGAAWIEEYLDGDDLGPLLDGTQWAWDDARPMGIQIANGLAAGHEKSVIHRDLSANNVRRLSNGTYKVLDFGFARHTLRSGVTVAGQPGTRGFLTPEHLNSYSGGPMQMSDVFQVGILMYTALSGVSPYPWRGDDYEYALRLQSGAMAPLSASRPDLSPEQVAVIHRALHPQPARRFRNAAALRDALEATA
ncbi:serine/threonine-protein kinase [Agromyces silvae]|uniref:serine/threonine-protein kinase n=1 Tax=Agromyces silvae TaxID=3388266 RepID=UPI00280B71F7|nr:serine/threonine-protein kinase [Agromyces protaetiae]